MSVVDENVRLLWFEAAKVGRVEALRDLLELGADIDAVDNMNQNACYLAIENDHFEAVEFLLARRIKLMHSLMDCALGRTSDRFAIALIDAGASIERLNQSQLLEACGKSAALLLRMLDRGVDIVALCNERGGVLSYVMWSPHNEIADILRIMHRHGVDLLGPSRFVSTIHHAAMQENLPAMRVFIELGIDVDHRNPDGLTALHTMAAEAGFELFVEHLLAGGADFRLLDNRGESPLHAAARNASSFGSLCALLAVGADLDQAANDGSTPRQIAIAAGCRLPSDMDDADVVAARRRISAARLDFVRRRAFEVCVGLQPLGIDALQMCEVMLHACGPVARHVAFHQWWLIATAAKHFHRQ